MGLGCDRAAAPVFSDLSSGYAMAVVREGAGEPRALHGLKSGQLCGKRADLGDGLGDRRGRIWTLKTSGNGPCNGLRNYPHGIVRKKIV